MVDPSVGAGQSLSDVGASLDQINVSADRVASTLTNAFARAVTSGQSFDKTLQSVLSNLSKMSLNAGLQPLQQGLSALVSSAFGSGGGGLRVTPFAQGGVVAQPTFFASGGGVVLTGGLALLAARAMGR